MRLNETILALTTEARERKRAEDELRQAHDELEQRVVERTAELSRALARLESEISVSEKKEEQLRDLSIRLMTLQDEERRRIARELHDSAGQTLAAMKMSIALVRRSDTGSLAFSRLVDDLEALADEALQAVRTTSYLLHPLLATKPASLRRPVGSSRDSPAAAVFRSTATSRKTWSGRPETANWSCSASCKKASLTFIAIPEPPPQASGQAATPTNSNLKWATTQGHSRRAPASIQYFCWNGSGITGLRERARELGGRLEIHCVKTGTTVSVALPALKSPPLRKPAEVSLPS